MRALFRAGVVVMCCATVAGCSVPVASPAIIPAISAHDARDAIAIGRSTKADVIAALGKATVVSFENGFEVWVYHFQDESLATPDARGHIGRAGPEKGNLA